MAYTIAAEPREKQASELRAADRLPGVVYGRETDPISFSVDYNEFEKLYREAGTSNLIELKIGNGEAVNVIIKDWQLDPVKDRFTHFDMYQVVMGEAIESDISLNFIGEAPAVKVLGGTLMTGQSSIRVKCLPKDLTDHIDVDLGALETFEDTITVGDLNLPAELECLDGNDIMVATVNAPLSEEQLAAMETSQVGDVEAVEVEEKGKAEEGDAAKAETPAADGDAK